MSSKKKKAVKVEVEEVDAVQTAALLKSLTEKNPFPDDKKIELDLLEPITPISESKSRLENTDEVLKEADELMPPERKDTSETHSARSANSIKDQEGEIEPA
jgi:hypothetical protein